jgi:GH15 family glucan-1,4-alpha-glucosidase
MDFYRIKKERNKLLGISSKINDNILSNLNCFGGIRAASSSHLDGYSNDAYSYCWPRDGAIVSLYQFKKGRVGFARSFCDFIVKSIKNDGSLPQRVFCDAKSSVAPGWTDQYEDGSDAQRDQIAMVLKLLCKLSEYDGDFENYKKSIRKLSDGLINSKGKTSFDLWEEVKGYHFYTSSAILSSLYDSLKFEYYSKNKKRVEMIKNSIFDVKKSLVNFKGFDDFNCGFIKSDCYRSEDSKIVREYKKTLLDSSVIMAFVYFSDIADEIKGLRYPFDFKDFDKTFQMLVSGFRDMYGVNKNLKSSCVAPFVGRYFEDKYDGVGFAGGNPWPILTAVFGSYCYLRRDRIKGRLFLDNLFSVVDSKKGFDFMFSEQIDKDKGGFRGANNLTWSNVEVDRLINYEIAYLDGLIQKN